jgi:hypothetical protein
MKMNIEYRRITITFFRSHCNKACGRTISPTGEACTQAEPKWKDLHRLSSDPILQGLHTTGFLALPPFPRGQPDSAGTGSERQIR